MAITSFAKFFERQKNLQSLKLWHVSETYKIKTPLIFEHIKPLNPKRLPDSSLEVLFHSLASPARESLKSLSLYNFKINSSKVSYLFGEFLFKKSQHLTSIELQRMFSKKKYIDQVWKLLPQMTSRNTLSSLIIGEEDADETQLTYIG